MPADASIHPVRPHEVVVDCAFLPTSHGESIELYRSSCTEAADKLYEAFKAARAKLGLPTD